MKKSELKRMVWEEILNHIQADGWKGEVLDSLGGGMPISGDIDKDESIVNEVWSELEDFVNKHN